MKARVSLVRSPDYDESRVYDAVQRSLAPLGGMSAFVKPGQRVLLQTNSISPRPPEDAVCTHPSIVKAVCRLVMEAGGIALVGASAGGTTAYTTRTVLKVSKTAEAAESVGAEVLNYDEIGGKDVPSRGVMMDTLHIAIPALESDVLITLPKMKTHGLTLLTGAVKNHLGLLPGPRKSELHRRFPLPDHFSAALVDIFVTVPPSLAIMDAIQGMDGNGPTAGRMRHVGLVASSPDGVALDAVMCAICRLDPEWVGTLKSCRQRGIGKASLEEIEVIGPSIETLRREIRPFAYPMTYQFIAHSWIPGWARDWTARRLSGAQTPFVITDKCNGCQTCVKSCPAQTIMMVDKKAQIQLEKCISCFCCHELCLQQAIGIKVPRLWTLFADDASGKGAAAV